MLAGKATRLLPTHRQIVKPSATGPYNTGTFAATAGKNADGSTSSNAIELGVVYNPAGVLGHKYWLAFAPYTSASTSNENPHLASSDDGNTWTTLSPQPLVAYPGGGSAGNNADPAVFDNVARDGLLYVLFTRENASSGNGVYVLTYNGTAFSGPTQILASSTDDECPVIVYDTASTTYWLYTLDLSTSTLYRRSASSPTGTYGARTACTTPMPGGRTPWHTSAPVKIGSKWLLATSDTDSPRNGWLLSSTDGLTWTCSNHILIKGITATWDAAGMYRLAIADAGDGLNLYLWYVTGLSGTNQVSQRATVPQSEIP